MNSLKVKIPKGCEIDVEKSNLKTGEIVFKDVNEELAWEDFGNLTGYYIDEYSDIEEADIPADKYSQNVYPTYELAVAALALCQLLQWRDRVWKENCDWKPNWNDIHDVKNIITTMNGEITTSVSTVWNHILVFPSTKVRDKFLKQHRSLIEKAKILL